jgi:hypothetical protein
MPNPPSLLDQLRAQYEAARQSPHQHSDVEGFQAIDSRMRKSFRWLERAVTHLDGLKPAIEHQFDVDRLDRVTLEFHSNAIEEPVLEDLLRLILGQNPAFLRRAPLAGLHPRQPAAG